VFLDTSEACTKAIAAMMKSGKQLAEEFNYEAAKQVLKRGAVREMAISLAESVASLYL
jgi:uncharacterized protein YaaW (UPF0174 family)